MGEMADFVLERAFEEEDARARYRRGKMSDYEAYEQGIIDELGAEIGPYPTYKKTKKENKNGLRRPK